MSAAAYVCTAATAPAAGSHTCPVCALSVRALFDLEIVIVFSGSFELVLEVLVVSESLLWRCW